MPGAPTASPAPVPAEAQQQFNAALSLVSAGKSEEALQQFEKLAAAYPAYASPLINAGQLHLKLNRMEMAINSFKSALERDPHSAIANNYLGLAYRQLGQFKEAEQAYQAAIAASEDYAPAELNLGVLYDLYLQQPESALMHYERYQSLIETPDAKVAAWIKELKGRIANAAKGKTGAGS